MPAQDLERTFIQNGGQVNTKHRKGMDKICRHEIHLDSKSSGLI
jgi:hypothetical protein